MSSSHLKSISFFFFCLCLFIWTSTTVADDRGAEANKAMLFSNGPILTMEGKSPSFV
ncbi:MAG: hypothetical protein MK096_07060 [Oleiphilaceae bacterium]|nr:hypothetical protein [Oleiphilaceae bacterium]